MQLRSELILNNFLLSKYAKPYVDLVLWSWHIGTERASKNGKMWSLFDNEEQITIVALEVFAFVMSSNSYSASGSSRRSILAAACGKRAEFALWMLHPQWKNSWHAEGMKTLLLGDLSMPRVLARLTSQGFGYASSYKPLTLGERSALGTLFLECLVEATGLFVMRLRKEVLRPRRHQELDPSPLYWEILDRWQDVRRTHAPVHAPMMVPPRSWTGQHGGGYLSLMTDCLAVEPHLWPLSMGKAKPCVIGSINRLQQQAMRIDKEQLALARHVWELGHEIGGLPSRERLPFPDTDDRSSQFWTDVWHFNEDRRKDSERRRFVNSLIQLEHLEELGATELHWVRHIDYRGRLYSRGGFSYQSGRLYRSCLQWARPCPVNTDALAYALGDYAGVPIAGRTRWMLENRERFAAIGRDPLRHLDLWSQRKNPWLFIQACRELAHVVDDPSHLSGLPVRLDQSSSGYGHLACLLRDAELGRMANVIGTRKEDLYSKTGELARLAVTAELPNLNAELSWIARWWLEHWPSRELLKVITLPRIYGQRYSSAYQAVRDHLRVAVSDLRLDGPDSPRLIGVAHYLARHLYREAGVVVASVKLLNIYCRELGKWMMDQGLDPCWYAPTGMRVTEYFREGTAICYSLPVGMRTVRMKVIDGTNGALRRPKGFARLGADMVHSYDAAFAHQFIEDWRADAPIEANHDCFATDLQHLGALRSQLNRSWNSFYQEDWAARMREQHAEMAGVQLEEVPSLEPINTMDLAAIGENPNLFT
jgi:DNA-directed RNA polymerase